MNPQELEIYEGSCECGFFSNSPQEFDAHWRDGKCVAPQPGRTPDAAVRVIRLRAETIEYLKATLGSA